MIKFLTQLLDLIYKKRCHFCGQTKESRYLCSACLETLSFLPVQVLKYLEGKHVYSAMIYKDGIRKLIKGLKYQNEKECAAYAAQIMYEYWKQLPESSENYVLVPVPLYKKREKQRRYNHMLLVAEEFSKLTGYEIKNDLVSRVKNTKPQFGLSMKDRQKNLKNAFSVEKEKYEGGKVLILDDILTTGSTVSEMIKVFGKNGIKNVAVLVTSCTEYNVSDF